MMPLEPHHLHGEPDPHGKQEEAEAPYHHLCDLRDDALKVLGKMIDIAGDLDWAFTAHDDCCLAFDAVASIDLSEGERPCP